MSALPADLQLRPRGSAATSSTPRLRSVPEPQPRLGGIGFVLLLTAILAAGMFGLVMLNTQIQDQSFELTTLRRQADTLTEKEAALQTQLNTLTSAKDLADRASALGMVPAVNVGILKLDDGSLTGKPEPVGNFDLTNVRTPAQIAAAEAAAKAKAEEEAKKKAAEEAAKKAEEEAKKKAAEEAAKKATQQPAPPPTQAPPAPTPKPTQTTGR